MALTSAPTAVFHGQDLRFRDVFRIERLSVPCGTPTVVTGPSGSGKSTLLKALVRLVSLDEGVMWFHGVDVATIDPVALRRRVVMLGQQAVRFGGTVRDELQAGRRWAQVEPADDALLIDTLQSVRLDKTLEDDPAVFSGGELQRLALARVLLTDAQALLLDEPTAALGVGDEERILALLAARAAAGTTVVIASHARDLSPLGDANIVTIAASDAKIDGAHR